jgi:hypothetical protein
MSTLKSPSFQYVRAQERLVLHVGAQERVVDHLSGHDGVGGELALHDCGRGEVGRRHLAVDDVAGADDVEVRG